MADVWDYLVPLELRGYMLLVVLSSLLGIVAAVAIHEAGHAMFGRIAGYRIRLVRIGRGPEIFRCHVGYGLVRWHLWPISGSTSIYRPFVSDRKAALFLVSGGCLANATAAFALAVMLVALPWQKPEWALDPQPDPVLLVLFLNQIAGVLNLALAVKPGRFGPTDGWLFWQALRRPDRTTKPILKLYDHYIAERYANLPVTPASPLGVVVLHAVVLGTPESNYGDPVPQISPLAFRERERLRRALLSDVRLTQAERAALLDGLVSDALLASLDDTLPAVDAWSAELLALVPHDRAIQGMRGAVLVMLGHPEGRTMLEAGLDAEEPSFDAGLRRIFLAREALDRGARSSAAALLDDGRRRLFKSDRGGTFPVLRALEAELGERPS